MTLRDFAQIALRVGAVIIAIDTLTSLPMAFSAARYYAPMTFSQQILESTILPFAASLCITVLIYGFAEEIADRVVLRGKTELQVSAPADLDGLEQIAVAILGAYFLVTGLADVVHGVVRYLSVRQAMGTASEIVLPPDTVNLGSALFRTIIGAFLIRYGNMFVRLRRGLRAKRGIAGEDHDEAQP
jgi:hypothetical protein